MKPQWVWVLIAGVELVLVILTGLRPLSQSITADQLPSQLSLTSLVLTVFALAFLAVSIWMLIDPAEVFALVAMGLAIFLGIALAGLAAGAAVFADEAISTQVVLTAGAVSLYVMLIMYVRNAWILVPTATLVGVSGRLTDLPPDIPRVPLWSDGFLVRERQGARIARLAEVRDADDTALDAVRVRAYRSAKDIDDLKEQRTVLAKPVSAATRRAIRSAALDVAVVVTNKSAGTYILLVKVQNQLLVLALLLLAAVATFGIVGWALPMIFGAVGALIARVRTLTPQGDPAKVDGGPRWMALLLTPLVGAVSSVVGLVLIKALEEFGVLSDDLAKVVPVPSFDGMTPYFPIATLAIAAAFGWTARLLDALMAKVTALVDEGAGSSGSGASGTAPTANDPAANDPAANDPAANDPAANDPAANDPAANDPAANDPAATNT